MNNQITEDRTSIRISGVLQLMSGSEHILRILNWNTGISVGRCNITHLARF